jgi:hypothetical protein
MSWRTNAQAEICIKKHGTLIPLNKIRAVK